MVDDHLSKNMEPWMHTLQEVKIHWIINFEISSMSCILNFQTSQNKSSFFWLLKTQYEAFHTFSNLRALTGIPINFMFLYQFAKYLFFLVG